MARAEQKTPAKGQRRCLVQPSVNPAEAEHQLEERILEGWRLELKAEGGGIWRCSAQGQAGPSMAPTGMGGHGRKEAQRVQKLPGCSSSMGPARSTMVDLN